MAESTREIQLPLCIDCDGTLIKTALLFEAFFVLLNTSPRACFCCRSGSCTAKST